MDEDALFIYVHTYTHTHKQLLQTLRSMMLDECSEGDMDEDALFQAAAEKIRSLKVSA